LAARKWPQLVPEDDEAEAHREPEEVPGVIKDGRSIWMIRIQIRIQIAHVRYRFQIAD
jgi:hypothetical protein